jgi:hypothetical protein
MRGWPCATRKPFMCWIASDCDTHRWLAVACVDIWRLDLPLRAVSEVAEPFETAGVAIGMVAKGFRFIP